MSQAWIASLRSEAATLGRWLEQHGHGVMFDLQRRAEEVAVAQYVALAQQVGQAAN